ncbi:MAG: hypothetical protein HY665_01865 [Chloroflexi bacterium]|nr:hypothetical protein [Chloroflexota bacterium]
MVLKLYALLLSAALSVSLLSCVKLPLETPPPLSDNASSLDNAIVQVWESNSLVAT